MTNDNKSTHTLLKFQPFMGPRYPPGPRPGVRMQVQQGMGNEFNGVSRFYT